MKKVYALFASLMLALSASAQNPVIRDQFTADPTARVFNGRLYLFPSHDIPPCTPDLIERKWFCMEDYHVFSSDNLTDWTDHGVIVTQNRVPWVQPDSYTMWAPDCVEKDGRYYFFFPAQPKGGRGFGVGVAVAEKPEGPYRPMWRQIEGVNGIDPCVLKGYDGNWYIYWGGGGLMCARLKDDFSGIHPDEKVEELEFMGRKMKRVGVAVDKGLPEGFKEGPFAFTRNGKYYLTYPWVRGKKGEPDINGVPSDNHTETLAYAMSDSPYGPFEFKGLIMEEHRNGCWTNHHSLVEYKGEWYLFYHHNDYSPNFDKNRSVCIDKLYFNEDGTIQLVKPTQRGVGISSARKRIQIDRYSEISPKGGVRIEYLDTTNCFLGWKTVFENKNGWLQYNDVDFGGVQSAESRVQTLTVCAKSKTGGVLCISTTEQTNKRDGAKETVCPSVLLSKINIPKSSVWQTITVPVKDAPTGIQNIQVALTKGSNIEVDWIGFDALPWSEGAFKTGEYRNVFAEMGYAQKDIDAKLEEIYNSLFVNDGPSKIYFEVGDDMGYVSDIKNHDVRTEGMSYGMMVAVQLDKKDVFDRIWRWCKKYMQHQDGELKGYFRWSCKTDGTPNAQGPASDGELYYVTSLLFASNRWGNDTGINYLAEAQNILDQSFMKTGYQNAAPLINVEHKLITFTPDPHGGTYTDPSYHLPAFYEVWAKYAKDNRENFWRECAQKSREYLHKAIDPVTGLNPDYSTYDGKPFTRGWMFGEVFRFDSWRVPMNIALDYSWSCADREWQNEYADKIQTFLYSEGIDTFVDQYNLDGTRPDQIARAGEHQVLRHSLGLVATAAAVTLAATNPRSREFVQRLWEAKHEPYEDGYFDAYYDGLLRLFAFMHLSGKYRVIE